MASVQIRSGQGDYRVDLFPEISPVIEELLKVPHALFIVDRKLPQLYEKQLKPILEDRLVYQVEATESEKTLAGVERFALWLQENRATKQSNIIAMGGGIIQDIAAFTAHSYYRGIPWQYVPTTLLSMCDSSIGAKCSVNLGNFKSQLGFFQSPKRVFVATEFTRTLSDESMSSGYGEILKLMLTGSKEHLAYLERAVSTTGLRNGSLGELIHRSLEVKRHIIEADEYERDLRRILSYGHTFGLALEMLTENEICHGLAVAWGIDLSNFMSWKRGMLPEAEFERVHRFIEKNLPFRLNRPVRAVDLIEVARRDKKVTDEMVNLVFITGPGHLQMIKTAFDANLERLIQEYLESFDVYRNH